MRSLLEVVGAGAGAIFLTSLVLAREARQEPRLGDERAVPRHLLSGQELTLSASELVDVGRRLFTANWTDQDGAGRPLTKGSGRPLTDPLRPLVAMRAMNRVSGPDANSCAGCHNAPFAIVGGRGDLATVVFQMAERFDFVTFDRKDAVRLRGSLDEAGRPATMQTVGNQRVPPGLFGAGYLEMLARQITRDLQRTRDGMRPGQTRTLTSTGISFGTLKRRSDGAWDTSAMEGLPSQSLRSRGSDHPPTLVVRPWLQSGTMISLREVTNTSLNQHFGIQSTERFGAGVDPDGDGVKNEVTRGDVTALTLFQATLQVPGRVIPASAESERAVANGERLFGQLGCATCHVPALPLMRRGWLYSEPGPYERGQAGEGGTRVRDVDLTSTALPLPRLSPSADRPDVVLVPAYTDFRLHDITDPADASAGEPLDMNEPTSSPRFHRGNRRFLTKRLWGVANQPPYFHDGRFTTLVDAVLGHSGEARDARLAFERSSVADRTALIEFLQTLQVLQPGTRARVVDERGDPRAWLSEGSATRD